jgi:hypothetical protein
MDQQRAHLLACPAEPGPDGARGDPKLGGDLGIRAPVAEVQIEHPLELWTEAQHRRPDVGGLDVLPGTGWLRRRDREGVQHLRIDEELAAATATRVDEEVPHDSQQPGAGVGAGCELMEISKCALIGILNQISSERLRALEAVGAPEQTRLGLSHELLEDRRLVLA